MTSYFAPAFKVALDNVELDSEAAGHVLDIAVVSEPDTPDHFTLTLANPFPKLPWTHGSQSETFAPGTGITISMGYVDQLTQVFDGVVMAIKPTFPESGVPVVRVEGYTRLHLLNGPTRTRTFVKKTDKQIVEKVAGDVQLTTDVDQLTEQHPYVFQYNQTDLAFLLERARRIDHEISVEGKTLKFVEAPRSEGAAHTLVWGNPQQGVASTSAPLRTFNPTMNPMKPLTTVTVKHWHQKARQLIVGTAPSGGGGAKNGASVAADVGREVEKVVVNVPVHSRNEANALAATIYERHLQEFIVATGTTVGLPGLRAGSVVTIEGVGDTFSGDYYVKQATHSISSAGFSTTFSVRKGAQG